MAIYGRFGANVTIQRLATLADVRALCLRHVQPLDRVAISGHDLVVVSMDDGKLRVFNTAHLRADGGIAEINAVVAACVANGGAAP